MLALSASLLAAAPFSRLSICGRIGSILSPLVGLLPAPSAILGVIAAGAAVAVLALPETSGRSVPESIAAADADAAGSVPLACAATSDEADSDDDGEAPCAAVGSSSLLRPGGHHMKRTRSKTFGV